MPITNLWLALLMLWTVGGLAADAPKVLSGTEPLALQGDLSAQMVAGIDKFLMQEIDRSLKERDKKWNRDFASADAYQKSIEPNRERFRKMIGAVDPRVPIDVAWVKKLKEDAPSDSNALIDSNTL